MGFAFFFFFFVLHENVLVLRSRELQATSLTPVLQQLPAFLSRQGDTAKTAGTDIQVLPSRRRE